MDVNEIEKWMVVKECPIAGGILPINSEIHVVHGCVYFNGGLMESFYQNEFLIESIHTDKIHSKIAE